MEDSTTKLDPRVSKVRDILNLDDGEDDQLLSSYVASADSYVRGAITDDDDFYTSSDEVKQLFELAVVSLAGTYYQYRLSLSQVQTYEIYLTTNSVIGQLRGRYDVWSENKDGDTDGK